MFAKVVFVVAVSRCATEDMIIPGPLRVFEDPFVFSNVETHCSGHGLENGFVSECLPSLSIGEKVLKGIS